MENTIQQIQDSLWTHNPHKYREHANTYEDAHRILVYQQAMFFRDTPKQGEFMEAPDGTLRRIAHVWHTDDGMIEWQPVSGNGSYFMGQGYMSMSGSLESSERHQYEPTDRTHPASAWTWHRGWSGAGNGVNFIVNVRVWKQLELAPVEA